MAQRPNDISVFLSRFERTDGCWEWKGGKFSWGYGRYQQDGQVHMAHRLAYEIFVGPIPDELQLDHLCRNRGCVNPAHLEPVTRRENILRGEAPPAANARKKHCVRGHKLEGQNLLMSAGKRQCRACMALFDWGRTRRAVA